MKINKHLFFLVVISALLFPGCASTKKAKPEPFLKEETQVQEIVINFDDIEQTDKPSTINTDEETIEEYVNSNIEKYSPKSAPELVEEQKKASIIEPAGRHNFKNVITLYTFTDGKLYTILLSPDTVTDLRLEESEVPTGDVILSDSDNYTIDNSISYENGKEICHIFISPIDVSAPSSMILPTNKRTYYFRLVPSETSGMVGVKFIYKNKQNKALGAKRLGNIENLNFNYLVTGDDTIRPIAAFSDEKSTFIQFKPSFANKSASPALYLKANGDLSVINYSIKGNIYITDFILSTGESFVLMQDDKRVEIKRAI